MAGSEFDGNIDLNKAPRFIGFHPIGMIPDNFRSFFSSEGFIPDYTRPIDFIPDAWRKGIPKHVVVQIESISSLWTEANGCFICAKGGIYAISPSEYKAICQRLGVSDENP